MPKLPVIGAKKLVKFFKERGFTKARQKGSHIILEKDGARRPVVIPADKEVDAGIILNNLNTAGISRDEFIKAMQKSKKSASAD